MENTKPKRKLTAILSADVKGYSRLMADDEEATVTTINTYRDVMTSLIAEHHGRVVDAKGDNVLAEFASVVDAVRCSVDIQRELKKRNADLSVHRKMEFRIGVNLGDVIEEKETIYGDGVNVAARLEGLANAGGVCISGTAFDQVRDKLNLGYEYLGEQSVKNIPRPIRAYKVLMEAEHAGKVMGEEKPKPKQWRWASIGAVAILIIVAGIFAIWNFYLRPDVEPALVERMAHPLPDQPSIAVLPFDNMSGDPEQDYLADGISENIISALSRIPRLFVIARNSTFTYKGKPVKVQQVSEELGVRYVLEGSVQRSGNRLRVTAQLVDAIKGNHLWSETYDRNLEDIFAVQDEVTKEIIAALNVELTQGEQARAAAKGTDNLEAYLKFMQAQENVYRHTIESNALAQQLAQAALTLDPTYAPASRVLGITHMHDILLGRSKSPKESLGKAIKLVKKAIELDDQDGESHASLGFLLVMIRQYDKAVAEVERGVALQPNVADIYGWSGIIYRYVGRWKDAVTAYEKAIRLNPIPPDFYLQGLGLAYAWTGRYEEGIRVLKRAVQNAPDSPYGHLFAAAAYSMAGRGEEARTEADEVLRLNPKFSLEKWGKSLKYKNQADQDRLMSALRKAGLPETPPLPLPAKPSIAVLPFVNMSGDPEQEYFSDGISEEIITALSKTSKLFVIARTSSFKYKGKEIDVRTVGRELGVRYVLEGSVRKSGDTVRITAQLIDATTGNHVWAQRYDRDLKDIFALQDELTMKILTALQVKLTEGEQARIWGKVKRIDVYLKVLEARSLWAEGTKESHIRFGQIGQELINMAPEWVGGYRLMAWHQWYLGKVGKSPRESMAKAFNLAQKALHMDESDSSSHALVGQVYLLMRKYEKAIAAGERSVELDPNGAMARGLLGMTLSFADRPDEAIAQLTHAIRLNPFAPYWYFYRVGQSYMQKGAYEKSLKEYKKALQRAPNAFSIHAHLAVLYVLLDRQKEARGAANKVLELFPNFSVERIVKTMPFKNQDHCKLFFEAWQKAGLK
jgi:adenylate cyclase